MILFWKCVMVFIMAVFFPAAAVVAVKGFRDLALMMRDLDADNREPASEDGETS